MKRGIVALGLLVAFAAAASSDRWVTPAWANHMYPLTPEFWDVYNNGIGDPSVGVDADGSGWTQAMLDRLTEATEHWAAVTDFEPYRVVTGPNDFYVDGTGDSYCGGALPPQLYAGACVHSTLRNIGPDYWYDIHEVNVLIDPTPGIYQWWYGSSHTGDELKLDFRGVVTHELGHWVYLDDVFDSGCNYGVDMYTMCGEPDNSTTVDDDSWRMRSLTTHDINAANINY